MRQLYFFVHRSFFTFTLFAISLLASSQDVNYAWGRGLTGTGEAFGLGMAVDTGGYVYTVGFFRGTMDFDPGTGTAQLTSAGDDDMFISKLDASGNYVWAKRLGGTTGDRVNGIAIDACGNVYVTGYFTGTVDLDPGIGTAFFTSTNSDAFVTRLDTAGNYIWAKQLAGTGHGSGEDIAVDAGGHVYITGFFTGTMDVATNTGVISFTTNNNNDVFISKLNASGTGLWAKQLGGTLVDFPTALAVDAGGNVYTTGYFMGTGDFNPDTGVTNFTAAGAFDVFISKLDSAGSYVWARQLSGPSTDYSFGIAVDNSGNIYVAGSFGDKMDFDPGTDTAFFTSTGYYDVFICKLNNAGNYIWARQMGGTALDMAHAIALDRAGNVYTTGFFNNTADLDPGPGTAHLTTAGMADVFISKLDTSGNYVWAKQLGGTSPDMGYGISADEYGHVYTMGFFNGTADIDPGPDTDYITSAARGVFINKLTPATPSKVKKPHPRGHRSTANVFPVPAREHFTIQLATSSLLHTKAVLADVSGRPVKIIAINDYNTLVNMADLPYGMYVLQLADRSSIKVTRQP